MTLKTDLVIIGAGPGGYVAALHAAQLGAQVTLVEKKHIGGVCLNEGCIPTKALLRSAEVLTLVRRAGEFGVVASEPTLDWAAVQRRKSRLVKQITSQVELLLRQARVNVWRGTARFVSPHAIEVETAGEKRQVEAQNIIIATGAHPSRLPVPGLEGPDVIDHTGALSLQALPKSMLIIGGGAEGTEFASIFNAYGVKVTLVEMLPRLLPMMDADVGEVLEWIFEQRGIKVLTGSTIVAVDPGPSGLAAVVKTPDGEQRIEVEKILVSAGGKPDVKDLGLETAGVRYERSGIVVDKHLRTSVPHIYAIGDVTGGKMLAHVASGEGKVAVANALGHVTAMDYKTVPGCVFTIPEVAGIGLTEAEARQQGYEVRVGKFPFSSNGKAIIAGEPDGFVKVVSEAKYDQVLGLHVVGLHASDLVLEGGIALTLEATLKQIEATIHAHPTLGEAVAEAALAVTRRAIHSLMSYR